MIVPVASGSRPDRLLDVSGPQERVQRHTVDQILDAVPPTLDVPVPLMGEQLVDILRFFDTLCPVAEQVFVVLKISSRTSLRYACVASRSWWNSWWKCQLSCIFSSRKLAVQFLVVEGDSQISKVFSVDRVQQVSSRSLIFPVEVFKVFAQDKVHLHHPRLVKIWVRTCPRPK